MECPWRVRTDDAVLASRDDKEDDDGPMVAALERLVGSTVVSASVVAPARDLRLGFDNGLVLDVFASGSPRSDDDDYSTFTPLVIYAVGRGGRVETEERVSDCGARGSRMLVGTGDDAFGVPLVSSKVQCTFWFSGESTESESGEQRLQMRQYAPGLR